MLRGKMTKEDKSFYESFVETVKESALRNSNVFEDEVCECESEHPGERVHDCTCECHEQDKLIDRAGMLDWESWIYKDIPPTL